MASKLHVFYDLFPELFQSRQQPHREREGEHSVRKSMFTNPICQNSSEARVLPCTMEVMTEAQHSISQYETDASDRESSSVVPESVLYRCRSSLSSQQKGSFSNDDDSLDDESALGHEEIDDKAIFQKGMVDFPKLRIPSNSGRPGSTRDPPLADVGERITAKRTVPSSKEQFSSQIPNRPSSDQIQPTCQKDASSISIRGNRILNTTHNGKNILQQDNPNETSPASEGTTLDSVETLKTTKEVDIELNRVVSTNRGWRLRYNIDGKLMQNDDKVNRVQYQNCLTNKSTCHSWSNRGKLGEPVGRILSPSGMDNYNDSRHMKQEQKDDPGAPDAKEEQQPPEAKGQQRPLGGMQSIVTEMIPHSYIDFLTALCGQPDVDTKIEDDIELLIEGGLTCEEACREGFSRWKMLQDKEKRQDCFSSHDKKQKPDNVVQSTESSTGCIRKPK